MLWGIHPSIRFYVYEITKLGLFCTKIGLFYTKIEFCSHQNCLFLIDLSLSIRIKVSFHKHWFFFTNNPILSSFPFTISTITTKIITFPLKICFPNLLATEISRKLRDSNIESKSHHHNRDFHLFRPFYPSKWKLRLLKYQLDQTNTKKMFKILNRMRLSHIRLMEFGFPIQSAIFFFTIYQIYTPNRSKSIDNLDPMHFEHIKSHWNGI